MQSVNQGAAQPSICLIIPFFDEKKKLSFLRRKKFPAYFDFFLETFSKNKNVSLKIFTNISVKRYASYADSPTVSFHNTSLNEIFSLFKEKLKITDLTYKDFRAYKICDFKPTFGLVFSDYLQGFDYWGYCDVDMIIGDLSKFLCAEEIANFDLVSATNKLTGYMTIYKNNGVMNSLFRKSPDCWKVLNSPKNYKFDECGNNKIVAMEHVIKKESVNTKYIGNLVHNDCGSNNVKREWQYLWKDGKLIDCLANETVGALHIVKSKKSEDFAIERFQNNRSFLIRKQGIHFVN